MILFLKQLKTSEPYVQVKKDMVTKDVDFIELSLILCFKVETLPTIMEQAVNPYTEANSRMKISILNMITLDFFQWLILVVTLMDLNFLLQQFNALG